MKLNRGDNPCPYMGAMKADEKGRVTIPPEKSIAAVAPVDVRSDLMKLGTVNKYFFREIAGKVYRIGENGIQYTSVSKEKFAKIKKLHEEYFNHEKEDVDSSR